MAARYQESGPTRGELINPYEEIGLPLRDRRSVVELPTDSADGTEYLGNK